MSCDTWYKRINTKEDGIPDKVQNEWIETINEHGQINVRMEGDPAKEGGVHNIPLHDYVTIEGKHCFCVNDPSRSPGQRANGYQYLDPEKNQLSYYE